MQSRSTPSMNGASGVMAIILLETAVGASVLMWATGVWGVVRRGFFLLTGITAAFCAAGAWAITASETAGAGVRPRAVTALAIFTIVAIVWQILLVIRQEAAARVVGLGAAAAGVVALVLFAEMRDRAFGLGAVELLLGALFLGSTAYGL